MSYNWTVSGARIRYQRGSGHLCAKLAAKVKKEIRLGLESRGLCRGLWRGLCRGLCRGLSGGGIGPRSARLWKSELRISRGVCCCRYSFCCLKSHQLFAAGWKDPKITFVNSFRGPWKKCTNRRAFKVANAIPFRFFHAVTRTGRHCSQPRTQLALCRNGIFSGITPGPTESLRKG